MDTINNLWSGRAGLARSTLIRGTLAALGVGIAVNLWAQTIDDPVATIKSLSAAEVDESMAAVAQQVTASAPIKPDAVTTVTRAIYLKSMKTLMYTVELSQPFTPQQAAASFRGGLCKGRTVLAFMDRGITYQYSVTTPSQTYNITFKRADC